MRKLLIVLAILLIASAECLPQVFLTPQQVANTVITNAGQKAAIDIRLPDIEEGMRFTLFISEPSTNGQIDVETLDPMTWIEMNGSTISVEGFTLLRSDPHAVGSQVNCVAANDRTLSPRWYCRNISGAWSLWVD